MIRWQRSLHPTGPSLISPFSWRQLTRTLTAAECGRLMNHCHSVSEINARLRVQRGRQGFDGAARSTDADAGDARESSLLRWSIRLSSRRFVTTVARYLSTDPCRP
jgi:hypothetical protein